jgi:hypothetical protein
MLASVRKGLNNKKAPETYKLVRKMNIYSSSKLNSWDRKGNEKNTTHGQKMYC